MSRIYPLYPPKVVQVQSTLYNPVFGNTFVRRLRPYAILIYRQLGLGLFQDSLTTLEFVIVYTLEGRSSMYYNVRGRKSVPKEITFA